MGCASQLLRSTLLAALAVCLTQGLLPADEDVEEDPTFESSAMNETFVDDVSGEEASNEFPAPLTAGSMWGSAVASSSAPAWGVRLRDAFPLYGGDPSLAGVAPISDELLPFGSLAFVDYDAFRGVSDGSWQNNGIRTGFNFATRLGRFSDWSGIGGQIGASVGVYDWGGTDYRLQNQTQVETQGFFTYGLFRRPTEESAITGGLVQDWMFNNNFGVFAQNPTLSQLRGQLGYAVSASNEFGLWGTLHVVSDTRTVPIFGPTTWRSVNQLSGYWHHKWHANGPDTWISVGVPSHSRLNGEGSLGDWLVSATALCPFSDAVALFSSVTYMHQSGAPGGESANDDAWNFTIGISFYPARNARTRTVAGQRWMPLLPVANNGSFLVDASQTY